MKKIDQYLKEQLPEEEDEKITKILLTNYFDQALEKKWNHILEQKYKVIPPDKGSLIIKSKKNIRRVIGWCLGAAAIILCLVIAQHDYLFLNTPDTQELIAFHLNKKEEPLNVRKGEGLEDVKMKAVTAYMKEDFPKAIQHYQTIIASENYDITDYYYLGLSHLYNKQPSLAIQQLEQAYTMPTTSNFKFKVMIEWYLALAYIQAGESESAKEYLQKIMDGKVEQYKPRALEMLERI